MIWKVFKTAIDQWFRHRSARLGAALAYYSVFSMGPLLLIVTSVAGLFFGADAVRGSLTSAIPVAAGRDRQQGGRSHARRRQLRAIRPSRRHHRRRAAARRRPWRRGPAQGRHEHHLERRGAQGDGRVVVSAHLPDLVRRHPRPGLPAGGLPGRQHGPGGALVSGAAAPRPLARPSTSSPRSPS